MGKPWVLDTESKGTGAQMVPLEKLLRKPAREPELSLVRLSRPPPPPPAAVPSPQAKPPRRFKVVDVMTRQTLAEGASTRATVELLERVRSVVDVTIHVWQPHSRRWRPLTLAEQRTLWEFRASSRSPAAA